METGEPWASSNKNYFNILKTPDSLALRNSVHRKKKHGIKRSLILLYLLVKQKLNTYADDKQGQGEAYILAEGRFARK